MCCPYECQPQICSSNESLEEEDDYDPCCSCPACREPCPQPSCPPPSCPPFRPCTPFPCSPRRPPRPCTPCPPPPRCAPRLCSPPPPRCPPRACNPCPPPQCCFPPPCCPCKVKGKFGLAYIVETPKNRCETPLGWQIEFEDTPSKIASSCKKMMQWVNCPPLGECGTEAVMSGYPKKCARAFATNPKSCCYEDEAPPPCDCESEPKCCCRPKPQPKCCKPRPQRRKSCCCPPPQPSCCCGKQEPRKRYEEAGCSCSKKRGSNTPRGDDDSLDYVPDKEVLYKNKNGRENQKKEQRKDSKFVQHDQPHHVKDEETNRVTRASSILSGKLVFPDVTLTASKDGLYSKNSLLRENDGEQNGNQDPASSATRNAMYSKNSIVGDGNNTQNGNQYPTLSVGQLYGKDNLLSGTNSKKNINQGVEDNKADSTNKDTASRTTQIESEINVPVADYDALIKEESPKASPNKKVMKMDYKTLREKIRDARKHQVDVIHQEAEKLHELEEKLKEFGPTAGNQNGSCHCICRVIQEDRQTEKQFESRVSNQSNANTENKSTRVSSQLNPTTESKIVDVSKNEIVGDITPEKQTDTSGSNQQIDKVKKSSDIVGVKILIEVKQSKKQIEQGNTMKHQLDVIKKASVMN